MKSRWDAPDAGRTNVKVLELALSTLPHFQFPQDFAAFHASMEATKPMLIMALHSFRLEYQFTVRKKGMKSHFQSIFNLLFGKTGPG